MEDKLAALLGLAYEVIHVDDGLEAWEIFESHDVPLDLVITDFILPGLSGLEFLKRIREMNIWFPFIIVTGSSTHARAEQAANLGASSYFSEPLDSNGLLKKIATLLNGAGPIHASNGNRTFPKIEISKVRPMVQSVLKQFHTKFNKRISLREVACSFGVSQEYLCRAFKKDCLITPYTYIEGLKIDSAMGLLENTSYSLERIAGRMGFYDESHFVRAFKKIAGTTPGRYRHQLTEKARNSTVGGFGER